MTIPAVATRAILPSGTIMSSSSSSSKKNSLLTEFTSSAAAAAELASRRPARQRKSVNHYSDDNPSCFTIKPKKGDPDPEQEAQQQPVTKQRLSSSTVTYTPSTSSLLQGPQTRRLKDRRPSVVNPSAEKKKSPSKSPPPSSSANSNSTKPAAPVRSSSAPVRSSSAPPALVTGPDGEPIRRKRGRPPKNKNLIQQSSASANVPSTNNTATTPSAATATTTTTSRSAAAKKTITPAATTGPRSSSSVASSLATASASANAGHVASSKRKRRKVIVLDKDQSSVPERDVIVSHAVQIYPIVPLQQQIEHNNSILRHPSLFSTSVSLTSDYVANQNPNTGTAGGSLPQYSDPGAPSATTVNTSHLSWRQVRPPYPYRTALGGNDQILQLPPAHVTCFSCPVREPADDETLLNVQAPVYCIAGDAAGHVTIISPAEGNRGILLPLQMIETTASARERKRKIVSKKVISYPNAVLAISCRQDFLAVLTASELEAHRLTKTPTAAAIRTKIHSDNEGAIGISTDHQTNERPATLQWTIPLEDSAAAVRQCHVPLQSLQWNRTCTALLWTTGGRQPKSRLEEKEKASSCQDPTLSSSVSLYCIEAPLRSSSSGTTVLDEPVSKAVVLSRHSKTNTTYGTTSSTNITYFTCHAAMWDAFATDPNQAVVIAQWEEPSSPESQQNNNIHFEIQIVRLLRNDDQKESVVLAEVLHAAELPQANGRVVINMDCAIQQESISPSQKFTMLSTSRGIRCYDAASLQLLAVYGDNISLHNKTVGWQSCQIVPAVPAADTMELKIQKKSLWLERADPFRKTDSDDVDKIQVDGKMGESTSDGRHPVPLDAFCLIGVPHPDKGPAELTSTLHVWNLNNPLQVQATLPAPVAGSGGLLGVVMLPVVGLGVETGWRCAVATAEHGQVWEWQAGLVSDFAGTMYPVRYQTVRDCLEYFEDEDELDQPIAVIEEDIPEERSAGRGRNSNSATTPAFTSVLPAVRFLADAPPDESETSSTATSLAVSADMAEAMRRSLMENQGGAVISDQRQAMDEDEPVSVLLDLKHAGQDRSTMLPCRPDPVWLAHLAESRAAHEHNSCNSKNECKDGFTSPVLAAFPQTTLVQKVLASLPIQQQQQIADAAVAAASQEGYESSSAPTLPSGMTTVAVAVPGGGKPRSKRARVANLEALLQASIDPFLKHRMAVKHKLWSTGEGSYFQENICKVFEASTVLEKPTDMVNEESSSREKTAVEASNGNQEQEMTGPSNGNRVLSRKLEKMSSMSSTASQEEKELAMELLFLSPSRTSPAPLADAAQIQTTVSETPHVIPSKNELPEPIPSKNGGAIVVLSASEDAHPSTCSETKDPKSLPHSFCRACRGRMVMHTCGKRAKPVDFEAIQRAEKERKEREETERQRLKAEKRRAAEAKRREARRKRKEEERQKQEQERKKQEEEARRQQMEAERIRREEEERRQQIEAERLRQQQMEAERIRKQQEEEELLRRRRQQRLQWEQEQQEKEWKPVIPPRRKVKLTSAFPSYSELEAAAPIHTEDVIRAEENQNNRYGGAPENHEIESTTVANTGSMELVQEMPIPHVEQLQPNCPSSDPSPDYNSNTNQTSERVMVDFKRETLSNSEPRADEPRQADYALMPSPHSQRRTISELAEKPLPSQVQLPPQPTWSLPSSPNYHRRVIPSYSELAAQQQQQQLELAQKSQQQPLAPNSASSVGSTRRVIPSFAELAAQQHQMTAATNPIPPKKKARAIPSYKELAASANKPAKKPRAPRKPSTGPRKNAAAKNARAIPSYSELAVAQSAQASLHSFTPAAESFLQPPQQTVTNNQAVPSAHTAWNVTSQSSEMDHHRPSLHASCAGSLHSYIADNVEEMKPSTSISTHDALAALAGLANSMPVAADHSSLAEIAVDAAHDPPWSLTPSQQESEQKYTYDYAGSSDRRSAILAQFNANPSLLEADFDEDAYQEPTEESYGNGDTHGYGYANDLNLGKPQDFDYHDHSTQQGGHDSNNGNQSDTNVKKSNCHQVLEQYGTNNYYNHDSTRNQESWVTQQLLQPQSETENAVVTDNAAWDPPSNACPPHG